MVPEVCLQQCLALKIKVGTLRIFFNLQEAVSGKPRPGRFTPGNNPVPIVQEDGWDPGPVWTGAEILAPTRIRLPNRPARSKSL